MCFSAQASFAAGGILIACGAVTLPLAWRKGVAFLPLAAYPVFFGIQQIAEGVLWLDIGDYPTSHGLLSAMVFLFFAFWFWPVWVPLSAAAAEPDRMRRRIFAALALIGMAGGAALYLPLLQAPQDLRVDLVHHSIRYQSPNMTGGDTAKWGARLIYAGVVCIPLLWSSHPRLRVFGLLILASVLVGLAVASYAFASIWCFLAAVLSAYMIVVLRSLDGRDRLALNFRQ